MIVVSNTGNVTSLIGCMQEVPDPRAPHNQRHKFLDIIMIAVAAMLCGTLGVENSLHWVPDIGFREDESRMRAGKEL